MALTLDELKHELEFQLQSVIRVESNKKLQGEDDQAYWLSGVREGLETAIKFISEGETK